MDKNLLIRAMRETDCEAVGRILAESFPALFRFAFGVAPDKSARILSEMYRRGVLSLEESYVAERAGILGVAIYEPAAGKPPPALRRYWPLLREHLGFFRGIRAMAGSLAMPLIVAGREPGKDIAYVDSLAVAESARRTGVGRALLDHCISLARQEGCAQIALHVRALNTAAVSLYLREGFEVQPEERLFPRFLNLASRRARTHLMVKEVSNHREGQLA